MRTVFICCIVVLLEIKRQCAGTASDDAIAVPFLRRRLQYSSFRLEESPGQALSPLSCPFSNRFRCRIVIKLAFGYALGKECWISEIGSVTIPFHAQAVDLRLRSKLCPIRKIRFVTIPITACSLQNDPAQPMVDQWQASQELVDILTAGYATEPSV